MRKFLALLFGLALFVPLAACGGGGDDGGSSGSSSSSASSAEEDEETTTTEADEEASGDSADFCGVVQDINDAEFDDLDFEDPEAVATALAALEDLQEAAPTAELADDLDQLTEGFQFLSENLEDLSDPARSAELQQQFQDEFPDFDAAGERVDTFSLDECGITVDGQTEDSGADGGETPDAGQEEAGDPEDPPSIDDAELESLAEDCFGGSGSACDDLFFQADVDSPEEDYGDTCGGRFEESPGLCATAIGD